MKTINRLALNGQEYFIKSGDSSPKEYVDITFASNLAGDTIDFTGKKVTVKYISDNTEYFSAQYDIVGDKAVFEVPAGTYYTIEYPEITVNGATKYKRPDNAETSVALAGRTRSIDALYKITKVKVQVFAEGADLTGLQITFIINGLSHPLNISEGQNYVEYFIPWEPYTVSFGALAGYIVPEDVSVTENQLYSAMTITGTYTKSTMGLAVYTKDRTEVPIDQWRTGLGTTYNNSNAVGIAIHTENANFVIYKGYPVQTNGAANFNLGAGAGTISTSDVEIDGVTYPEGTPLKSDGSPMIYEENGETKNLKDLLIDVGEEYSKSAIDIINAYGTTVSGKDATEILKQIYQNDENTPYKAGYYTKGQNTGKSFLDGFDGGVTGSAGQWYIGSAKEWYIASQQGEDLGEALALIGATSLSDENPTDENPNTTFTQEGVGCWTSTIVKKYVSRITGYSNGTPIRTNIWTYGYVYFDFNKNGFLKSPAQIAAPYYLTGQGTPKNWVCPFLSLDE